MITLQHNDIDSLNEMKRLNPYEYDKLLKEGFKTNVWAYDRLTETTYKEKPVSKKWAFIPFRDREILKLQEQIKGEG